LTRRLFLDVDGVLADFDGGVRALLGSGPEAYEKAHGRGSFWKHLARAPDFYGTLELLPDAEHLVEAVRHLRPTLLTGLPIGNWAAPQKRRWAARHFPNLDIITCMARDKWRHANPGDVLVDDRLTARAPWKERAQGIFIHHNSAADSLSQLGKYFDL